MVRSFQFALVAVLLLLSACASTSGSNQAPKINPTAQAVSAYRIGVEIGRAHV